MSDGLELLFFWCLYIWGRRDAQRMVVLASGPCMHRAAHGPSQAVSRTAGSGWQHMPHLQKRQFLQGIFMQMSLELAVTGHATSGCLCAHLPLQPNQPNHAANWLLVSITCPPPMQLLDKPRLDCMNQTCHPTNTNPAGKKSRG